jgi:hypothetical protein
MRNLLVWVSAASVPGRAIAKPAIRTAGDTETMHWDDVEPERLFEAIRSRGTAVDAERTVWAFERALAVARVDPELVRHLLVAAVCIVAYEDGTSPRRVLEELFRRSISDTEWRERFEPLLA